MPTEIASRGSFVASVASNVALCREHYKLTLRVPGLPASAPGQFVQVECREADAGTVDHVFDWSDDERPTIVGREFLGHAALLRRPFSIAGRRGDEIDLIGREVGVGTRFLARLNVGDSLNVIGPLGNTFALPDETTFELPGERGLSLLVGGGVGIPPMIYIAQTIAARELPTKVVAFAGAMTRDLMSLTIEESTTPEHVARKTGIASQVTQSAVEFSRFGVRTILTTDDGTLGEKGFVTDALDRYIDREIIFEQDRRRTTIYTCGPEPMMKRVQQIGAIRGIRVQVAVERAMACGMGTCQSCCIRVKKPDAALPPLAGKDWCYRLACTDGPVFEGDALLW